MMPTRRNTLARVVTLTLGAPLLGADTAAADQSAGSGATAVSACGTVSVLGMTGLPGAVAPEIQQACRQYQSLSLADIGHVDASAATDGNQIHAGALTARGTFDVEAITREVTAQTGFVRVDHRNSPTTNPMTTVGRDFTGFRQYENTARNAKTELLVRTEAPALIALDQNRIDASRGVDPESAAESLRRARRQSATAAIDTRTGLESILDKEIVAQATIGSGVSRRVCAKLPKSAENARTVIGALKSVGIAGDVAPTNSEIRYAVSLKQSHNAESAVTDLITNLADQDAADIHQRYRSATTFVVDATVDTDALWTVHERLFNWN